jgi:hypothetical protein
MPIVVMLCYMCNMFIFLNADSVVCVCSDLLNVCLDLLNDYIPDTRSKSDGFRHMYKFLPYMWI